MKIELYCHWLLLSDAWTCGLCQMYIFVPFLSMVFKYSTWAYILDLLFAHYPVCQWIFPAQSDT